MPDPPPAAVVGTAPPAAAPNVVYNIQNVTIQNVNVYNAPQAAAQNNEVSDDEGDARDAPAPDSKRARRRLWHRAEFEHVARGRPRRARRRDGPVQACAKTATRAASRTNGGGGMFRELLFSSKRTHSTHSTHSLTHLVAQHRHDAAAEVLAKEVVALY